MSRVTAPSPSKARSASRVTWMISKAVIVFLASAVLAVRVMSDAGVTIARNAQAQLGIGDPEVELSLDMTQVAKATRMGRNAPQSALDSIVHMGAKEPLAAEPFLVMGVQSELKGDAARAKLAFEAAQRHDPRSRPAALFLVQRYLASGDSARAITELGTLVRLSPASASAYSRYVAEFAKDPQNWPSVRDLFRVSPELRHATLAALAKDPGSTAAVLALADPREMGGDDWVEPLIATLTSAGKYDQARDVWQRVTGAPLTALLYDSAFRDKASPPPFNWSLTSSSVGIAERQQGGRLHLLFYGQEDGILASEMLLLEPGSYRLTMNLSGDRVRAHSFNWSIWCDKAESPIASVSLDIAAAHGWAFKVPQDCPAQWLRLSAVSGDIPQQMDITVGSLRLERVPAGA